MQFAMMCATGPVYSSLTFRPNARGWVKRRWCGSAGVRPHTMLLVAQVNGLAHDAAADGADSPPDFRENVDAFCAFDARLCQGSNMDGFDRRFFAPARRRPEGSSTSCASGVVSRFLSGSRW